MNALCISILLLVGLVIRCTQEMNHGGLPAGEHLETDQGDDRGGNEHSWDLKGQSPNPKRSLFSIFGVENKSQGGCLTDIECLYCCKNITCLNKKSCDQEWEKVNTWAFYQVFYTIGVQILLLTIFLIVSIMFKNKKNLLLRKLNTESVESSRNFIEEESSRKNTYFIA